MIDLAEIQAAYYMMAVTGVLVAAIYYVYNVRTSQRIMRTTLETRQMQMFMYVFDKHSDPDMLKSFNTVRNTHWNTFEEFRKSWLEAKNPEFADAMNKLTMFYEGLGVLVKERFVNIRYVALLMTGMTRKLWETIKPSILEAREAEHAPRMLSEFEYLYDELMKYIEKHPKLKT